ncbi:conserved hypothetical protein [Culex quinquefasciatus]|uniref:Uncharacterized protein n=1 Tax=Culex quinquefasciatus TaxID=7176 RepID=B0W4B5_CULQU|nr:conserved hypothetical protein [Culex quinquefasciatus]|eukprot:XP_001843557.1 conserved hypothetical protein [Culex quinquefasciatus]
MYFFGLTTDSHKFQKVERFVLIGVTWLYFLLGEAYLAKFICFMTNNKHVSQLRDIADFERSQYHICESSNEFAKMLSDVYPGILHNVGDDGEYCVPILSCTDTFLFIKTTERSMYTLSERLSWWISANIFSSKQRFAAPFQRTFRQLVESGLWDLWIDRDRATREFRRPSPQNVLNFEDLISLWLLLACGFSVAVGVLLMEWIWNRCIPGSSSWTPNRPAKTSKSGILENKRGRSSSVPIIIYCFPNVVHLADDEKGRCRKVSSSASWSERLAETSGTDFCARRWIVDFETCQA